MAWLQQNWFWIVVAVLFIWMHTKMHGGHGGHGGHCGRSGQAARGGLGHGGEPQARSDRPT